MFLKPKNLTFEYFKNISIHKHFYSGPPRLLSKDSLGDNRKVTRAGSAVNLQCPVEGNQVDDMYFEWFKDGKPVEMYDNRIRMTKRGRLKIKPATTEDTGKYYCKGICKYSKNRL